MALRTPPEVLLRQYIRYGKYTASQYGSTYQPSRSQCASSASKNYKAAVCTKLGQPLVIKEFPYPTELKSNEVLIATHAMGVNFADILISKGLYQDRRKTPFISGSELSGKVVEVGSDVGDLKNGDRVIFLSFAGSSAGASEFCVVDRKTVINIPTTLNLVTAAATIVSYGTAMMALTYKAKLKKHEKVLVTAATGATGLAAVDIAKNLFDCQVIAVCGGEEKCQFLKSRGADYTIDYSVDRIRDKVKEITQGGGVDVVMDQVGGETLLDCVKSLAFEGRAITVGYSSGNIPNVPANLLLLKSATLMGVYWGSYAQANPGVFGQSIAQVLKAVAEQKLQPYVGRTFPLEQINEAYQYVLDRKSTGKVVVTLRDEESPTPL
ncbi:quinone oxidoreductase-like protein 2 [Physella acuta]|uniref:quinone oxidoreductase-like protein 2 n=1 Tax=Physella acuta TaxID=109671 RepID=UPI0027DB0472|nr:quinone oxidoreductase-like protein 2 [Physella acuta]